MKQRVYSILNCRVFDLAVAFLNSFRKFNSDVPLYWIPFGVLKIPQCGPVSGKAITGKAVRREMREAV
jgi:hypothetical protein